MLLQIFCCLCSLAHQIKIKLFQTLIVHFQVFHHAKISQKVWSVLQLGINISHVWFHERSIVRKTFVAIFLLVLRGGLLIDLNLARVWPQIFEWEGLNMAQSDMLGGTHVSLCSCSFLVCLSRSCQPNHRHDLSCLILADQHIFYGWCLTENFRTGCTIDSTLSAPSIAQ